MSRGRDLADQDDQWSPARCHGPTLDLGCGPGRPVEALTTRGVPALAIDMDGTGLWCAGARPRGPHDAVSARSPRAVVGTDTVDGPAVGAGLRATRAYDRNRRRFAERARSLS